MKLLHDKNQGTGPKEEIGSVLYNRGMIAAAWTVEAVNRAQSKYGKKPLTGEQVRWGFENLAIDGARIKAMGFEGQMTPLSTSCADHMGANSARIHTWDGKKWNYTSETIAADMQIIKPMVDSYAKKYAAEKKIEMRDCAKDAG
jgi:branched-chain amino acid transport system substrate-binding protein